MASASTAAHTRGLQEGYSEAQWGPWKSHSLLLQQAIAELSWQESAQALLKLFKDSSRSREGHLSREEFVAVMHRCSCCNAAYHNPFFDLFDRNQDGYLNETDFLGGVLAVSPSTPHKLENPSGQLRMQFIFLYYDVNRNGLLEPEELAKMIHHIQQLRGQAQPADASADASALLSRYGGPFGFASFYDAVQNRMLNGTSALLRTQKDLLEAMLQRPAGADAPLAPLAPQAQQAPQAPQAPQQVAGGPPASKPAALQQHLPSAAGGAPINSDLGAAAPGRPQAAGPPGGCAAAPAGSGAPVPFASVGPRPMTSREADLPPAARPQSLVPSTSRGDFLPAQQAQQLPFTATVRGRPPPGSAVRGGGPPSLEHQPHAGWAWRAQEAQQPAAGGAETLALSVVRRLMDLSGQPRPDWGRLAQFVSYREMLTLCDNVVEVLRLEDSLVEVSLPCRVYGDIHGQLLDLLEFFNAFSWPDKRRGDIFSMNYVFLGDFVDRGMYSCDVISLLFSLKILYPSKIFLVRGNHEDRMMNMNFGFHADCQRKFGQDGEDVWQRVNDVFEFLPISALVERAILCIHGGIGDSIASLDDLRNIPKPISVIAEITPATTRQDRIVLDALWSDPTDNDQVLGVHSSPRGTNTCRFGPDCVRDFNQRNGLKLIIRAHECVQHGYQYFAGGQLLTVFSATNYCNQYNNDGAMVVLVKDERTGDVEEHAQVIKSGTVDTSAGWNDQQFRAPSPMRRAGAAM